ncbi:MAG: FAD-dependent oxidoreductase [Rhodobacteraceae bacterium]|nr:FAD-dependent oxidoreductase [Paracoccaceae bacterium]
MLDAQRSRIAVVGTGVSGLSAAWLINQRHHVTVFEKESWIGGHCNTVDAPSATGHGARIPVDTGFIVYNERTYPNLTALFDHLGVATEASEMSFSASVDSGRFEYSGSSLVSMFAQKRNVLRPRFWRMIYDIVRFYGDAVDHSAHPENRDATLGDYLDRHHYSETFLRDHLLPMGACIWSATLRNMREYPLASFVRFFQNHGLLELRDSKRPQWRTVTGGSRAYVAKIAAGFAENIRRNCAVVSITRFPSHVEIKTADGSVEAFDGVVIASHSDQALAMLGDASTEERATLGQIRYERNHAVLHRDESLMPRRRRAWASWNYIAAENLCDSRLVCLTYWMNSLQNIDHGDPLFVTLNPHRAPRPDAFIDAFEYEHPIFDSAALQAQRRLHELQGRNRTWFCGAYFGHGFHEDGLQAGLSVGEAVSGMRRPWTVADESGRIFLPQPLEAAA